jgi:hypothetical protein
MGQPGNVMTVEYPNAIMFVEVVYQYRPMFFGSLFTPSCCTRTPPCTCATTAI